MKRGGESPKGEIKKMEKEYYSLKELSQKWGLCKRSINNYVLQGKIKALRIGNKYMVHKSEVERIERRK